ncbi:DNA/RNA non-specific endonuclease, partial [bacterium]
MKTRVAVIILITATAFCATVFSKDVRNIKPHRFDPYKLVAFENEHLPWGYPTWHSDQVIYRDAYTMGYNFEKRNADWVCYHVKNKFYRSASYSAWTGDGALPAGKIATPSDYKKIRKKPQYEKGQLFPPELARGNKRIKAQAFYMSNVLPMNRELTRGPWKGLNKQIKYWSSKYSDINVCAGPVFTDDDGDYFVEYDTIGANNVAVPDSIYAVVSRYSGDNVKALAFLIPNNAGVKKQQAGRYLTTVDKV